ncbi:MAG: arylesterase [Verrucomicrobiota bacterium]
MSCGTSNVWAQIQSSGRKGAPARIVILGDSLTAGYGLQRDEAFPAILQRKISDTGLPFEVVAAGVSGDTTAGGLRRIQWALGPGAAVCILALGGNDGLRGVPPEQTEANLNAMIQAVRNKDPHTLIVLAGMPLPENLGADFLKAFAAVYPRVAEKNGVPLIPSLLEGVAGVSELNQPDLIHPTAEGQKRVAETVWKVLQPLLHQKRESQ